MNIIDNDDNPLFPDVDADINHFNQIFPDLNNANSPQYFNTESINNLRCNGNDLSVFHLNIRSINAHLDETIAFLKSINFKFDALCFSESWLHENNKHLYNIEGYNSFHSLRPINKIGGGLSTFINSNFVSDIIPSCTFSLEYIECLTVRIQCNPRNVYIATFYRPPGGNIDLFLDKFNDTLNELNANNNQEIIVCGDFNIDLLTNLNNADSLNFINMCSSFSLVPLISKPTRVTENTATLIDNIIVNNPIHITSGIITVDISDHMPVFIIRKEFFSSSKSTSSKQIKYRLVNERSLNSFYDYLSQYDFNITANDLECEDALNHIINTINLAYDQCCPIRTKTLSNKSQSKPWITNVIVQNIKKRQAYFSLYHQNKIPKNLYVRFRNFVTYQIRHSRKQYFSNKFNEYKNNIRKTWQTINDIIKPRSSSNKIGIKKLIVDNIIYENSKDIANKLNDFFTSVGQKISESMPANNLDPMANMRGDYPNSFFFQPVTPATIYSTILSLKNKSTDLSSISVIALKHISSLISSPFAIIINKSLEAGIFPNSMKIAKIIPIPKPGDPCNINNYRPISILPVFSKIFEKIVHNQIYNYFERFNVIYHGQYGFREKMSTVQAIANFTQYLYNSIDSGNVVFSVFLDFRKAFDSVDHEILLSKLHHYGIRGNILSWFKSYLCNRKQYTVVQNESSALQTITHGVPQGSILGPLLFLIFINDLPNSSSFFKYILFADDSTLSTSFQLSNIINTAKTINEQLNNVNNWLISNKICINASKTNYISFSYRLNIDMPLISIGSARISEVDSTKFLGIYLDKHLDFKKHVEYISVKLSKSLGIIRKLSFYLPFDILKMLYSSLILPYLSYGIEAWFATYKNITEKINIIQKKSIRCINLLPYNSHTSEYFKNMNLLNLNDQYNYQIAIFMYKTINSGSNPELNSILTKHVNIHNHNTRYSTSYVIPRCRRVKTKQCIHYKSVSIWNNMPNILKQCPSLTIFKKRLKDYLCSNY